MPHCACCRGGDPGAKVVSDGGPPTTREGRLLSWAGEIEAQVATQRVELRRARMELVAAQEVRGSGRLGAVLARAGLCRSCSGMGWGGLELALGWLGMCCLWLFPAAPPS